MRKPSPTLPSAFRLLVYMLSFALAFQCAPFAIAAQATPESGLKILVLEGEDAVYNIRERTAREAMVEIRDKNDKPVAGAVVLFTLPDRGAGATFPGGEKTLTVNTDAQGRAVARSIRPNNTAGNYEIRVSASHEGQTASTTIPQSNILGAAAGGISGGAVAAIIGVVAGAAVGLAVGLGGGDSGGGGGGGGGVVPNPSATISPGPPTVSGP